MSNLTGILHQKWAVSSDDEVSKQAVVLLQPLQSATREMSTDSYVSLSKVIISIAKSLQQLTALVRLPFLMSTLADSDES